MAAMYFKGQNKPKGIEVSTEKVEKRTIKEMVGASGKVFPETEIKISSDVSGEIVELFVEEGDSVVAGQILCKVDPDTYKSMVERGEATVNSSKAQVANSKSGVARSQAQLIQAQAQLEQIQTQVANQKNIHTRNASLFKEGVISQADFENSEASLAQLEANLRSTDANIKTAQANLESSQQSVKAAEFSVKSSEASLKEMKTSLRRTTILARTSGIISKLNIEKGAGKVTEIANSANNTGSSISLNTDAVTNFVVKIRIDADSYKDLIQKGKPYPFRPGMSASVDINTETQKGILTVPIQSVTTREEEKKEDEEEEKKEKSNEIREVVFVMSADTARILDVKTGIQDDEYIQILSGLSEGDEVISGPYSAISRKLKAGTEIRKEDKDKKKKEGKKNG